MTGPAAAPPTDRGLRPEAARLRRAAALGRPVVVLGMHRSGTSAVTRVVNLLGLPLCRRDDLYLAADNPAGHWESTSVVGVNDALLAEMGGPCWAPPVLLSG